jgi:hypothetical protein
VAGWAGYSVGFNGLVNSDGPISLLYNGKWPESGTRHTCQYRTETKNVIYGAASPFPYTYLLRNVQLRTNLTTLH